MPSQKISFATLQITASAAHSHAGLRGGWRQGFATAYDASTGNNILD
jgi:hypothetical protein